MAYNFNDELARVTKYYNSDPLQKRFSALITGETGSGKTYLLRTCRMPLHLDSFDPGGSKCLAPWIRSESNPNGQIVVDTQWENEDPYNPTVFAEWMKAIDIRLRIGYYKHFGTAAVDSASSWGSAAMNYMLGNANAAGEAPKWNRDYTGQKTLMVNYIKKLMNIPCDFFLTGHLTPIEELIGQTKDGQAIKKTKYRFFSTGQAVITIPMQFDELYVMKGDTSTSAGTKREMLIDAQGTYLARSRLKADGKLKDVEVPDIKNILKKIGKSFVDLPKLEPLTKEVKEEQKNSL